MGSWKDKVPSHMTRTFLIIPTIFVSIMTNGQDTTFDKKVEQLFFGVNVSNPSTELIDKFSKVTELEI